MPVSNLPVGQSAGTRNGECVIKIEYDNFQNVWKSDGNPRYSDVGVNLFPTLFSV